jgi:signal transduction histidine kinase
MPPASPVSTADGDRAKPTIITLAGVALAYYAGAEAAFFIGTLSDRIFAPFWPPNVILFCVLLTASPRHWWMFVAATFPAHVAAEIGVGMPPAQYLVAFATNCAIALLNAFAVRRYMIGPGWLGTLHQAGTYVLITVVVSPAVCALGGALVPLLSDGEITNYWVSWAHWYSANALASATLGAAALTWLGEAEPSQPPTGLTGEALLLSVALVIVCATAFGAGPSTVPSGFLPTLLYLPLPLVLWAAIRFGARGASAAVLIVTLVSISSNLRGSTVFDSGSAEFNSLALQVFLIAFSVPVLLLGATIQQQASVANKLQAHARALLRAQDDERRRIARALHDGTGQSLAGANLIAHGMVRDAPQPIQTLAAELSGILQQSVRELRTLSGLLHPPLLDEMGLAPALRSYVHGFAARNAIAVDIELPEAMERLDSGIELALFRVIQEALTNVLRHSGSRRARIRVCVQDSGDARELALLVEDFGRGFATQRHIALAGGQLESLRLTGTGLRGMHERLRQIGGRLHIDSSIGRTVIAAMVPLNAAPSASDGRAA